MNGEKHETVGEGIEVKKSEHHGAEQEMKRVEAAAVIRPENKKWVRETFFEAGHVIKAVGIIMIEGKGG